MPDAPEINIEHRLQDFPIGKPSVIELINGFQIRWGKDLGLVAKITRLRVPSDGQVRGELEMRYTNTHGEVDIPLLVPTQFNFSSEVTRAKFARQLTQKFNQTIGTEVEWRDIFDYLSQEVQVRARAGDGFVEVFPDQNTPSPEQLIEGIIYKHVQNIIFGEKGVSKSTVAYLLGMCVTLPWVDNPFSLSVPSESIKTLVLDWETDESIFRYYVSRLQKGMDIPYCSLYYRRCTLPLADDVEAIQKHMETTGARFLIIDSLGAAAGGERGELTGSEAALLFNSALRKLKCTSLAIAQTAKGDGSNGKKKTIFGSTYFTYYARNIFELCANEDNYGDVQHLGLLHRECNLGRRLPPMGFSITFQENGGISVERETFSISEFAQKVSAATRILEELKRGKMSQADLKDKLGVSHATLSMALKRLAAQEKVAKVNNEWGLVTNAR